MSRLVHFIFNDSGTKLVSMQIRNSSLVEKELGYGNVLDWLVQSLSTFPGRNNVI